MKSIYSNIILSKENRLVFFANKPSEDASDDGTKAGRNEVAEAVELVVGTPAISDIQSMELPEGEDSRAPKNVIVCTATEKMSLPADHVIHRIGEGENTIDVTAGAAFHIYQMHISGKIAGSQFPGMNLADVMEKIETQFDLTEVARAQREGTGPLKEHKYVGAVDVGLEATTGVATVEEMRNADVITAEQVADYDAVKNKVATANRSGDQTAQNAVMKEFNSKGYPIYLARRFPGSPVIPFFDTNAVKTSKMTAIVIGGKLITTMTGEPREKLPFPPTQGSLDYIKNSFPDEYERLISEFGDDAGIIKALEEDFDKVNSPDWLQAGFIGKREVELGKLFNKVD